MLNDTSPLIAIIAIGGATYGVVQWLGRLSKKLSVKDKSSSNIELAMERFRQRHGFETGAADVAQLMAGVPGFQFPAEFFQFFGGRFFKNIFAAKGTIGSRTAIIQGIETNVRADSTGMLPRFFISSQLSVHRSLPDVLLHPKNSKSTHRYVMDDNRRTVELEGDFNDYFDVEIQKGSHIGALSLLTPDVMQMLKDNFSDFYIAFQGNQVLFTDLPDSSIVYQPQGLEDTLDTIYRFFVLLDKELGENHF